MSDDISSKRLPADLVNDLLADLEQTFYPQDRDVFFRDSNDLIRCLTYPASHLEKKGARLSAERYRAILLEKIIGPMKANMAEAPRYFPKYFRHVVQKHMEKHWEEYYEQAKSLGIETTRIVRSLKFGGDSAERDLTIQNLAAIHRTLALKSGRKKSAEKQARGAIQIELF